MEQNMQKDVERINRQLENTNRAAHYQEQVTGYLQKGVTAFSVNHEYRFGADSLKEELRYGPDESGRGVYQQSVKADLISRKDIVIPHQEIEGVNTLSLESRIKNPPSPDLRGPVNSTEFQALEYKHREGISNDMKTLMDHKPEVFVLMVAKYNPSLDFTVPTALQDEQERVVQSVTSTNTFNTYFNLSPIELYNAMHPDRAVNKDLFRKPKDGDPVEYWPDGGVKNIAYNAWVQVDWSKEPDEKGMRPMKMYGKAWGFEVFQEANRYNFRELLSDNDGRNNTLYFLKKGSEIIVNNLNDTGDRKVKIRANPSLKKLDLLKLTGEKIANHNEYLKNPLVREIGETIEFKKSSDYKQINAKVATTHAAVANTTSPSIVTSNGAKTNTTESHKNGKGIEKKTLNKDRSVAGGNKGNTVRH